MAQDLTMFVPEIWSQKLSRNFDKKSVMLSGGIVNTDHEGEISQFGDTVHVQQLGDVTVNEYSGTINTEDLSGATDALEINKQYYFAFKIGDVEEAQSNTNLINGYSDRAMSAMKIKVDTLLLAEADSCHADNIIGTDGTPIELEADNVIDYIMELGLRLDNKEIPDDNRKLVIPPWMRKLIKQSDLADASKSGDPTSMQRTGFIGMIDRFEIFISSNIKLTGSPATTYNVLACIPDYLTFANQLTKVRAIELEGSFDTQISGLQLFGYQVFDQNNIAGACLKCKLK